MQDAHLQSLVQRNGQPFLITKVERLSSQEFYGKALKESITDLSSSAAEVSEHPSAGFQEILLIYSRFLSER